MGGIYTARSPLRECLMSHNQEPAAGDRPEEVSGSGAGSGAPRRQFAPGSESQFVVYPDAPHAFFADYRPSDREQAARDAWARCLDWFKKHGSS